MSVARPPDTTGTPQTIVIIGWQNTALAHEPVRAARRLLGAGQSNCKQDLGTNILANSASLTKQIADQYAGSLFELAQDADLLDATEEDLARFDALIRGSQDLARLLRSPVYSAKEQAGALDGILNKVGIGGLVGNFIRVVAANRRLFAMKDMLGAYRRLLAEYRGEIAADITVARKLSAAQKKELQNALKGSVGKNVTINEMVDPAILGGIIVKVGSRQIDTSLQTKLSSLKLALKEVD